jgi:hypothetical protein
MSQSKKAPHFTIPKQFDCVGATVTVSVERHDSDKAGHFYTEESKITLAPSNEDYMHHTFWHEFIHCAAAHLGWPELEADESKIDALAGVLVQFFKTRKG